MKIKVGQKVTTKTWSGSFRTGVVSNIQVCKIGEKYGANVESCDTDTCSNGTIQYGNYWCYLNQIVSVED